MGTHSSILAWRIQWTEEPGGLWLWSRGRKESDTTEATQCAHVTESCFGDGLSSVTRTLQPS